MMNSYILSYSAFSANPTHLQLFNFVRYNRLVEEYHQPFAGTVFIRSGSSLADLSASFKAVFEPGSYLLTTFQPYQTDGLMPNEVWAWLVKGINRQTDYSALTGSLLGSLAKPTE